MGRHKLRLNCEGKLTRQLDRGLELTEIQVLLTLFCLLRAVSSKVNREVLKIMSLRTKTTKCRFSRICISQLQTTFKAMMANPYYLFCLVFIIFSFGH